MRWNIVEESNDENGNPTLWASAVCNKNIWKYVWIELGADKLYHVLVKQTKDSDFLELKKTKSFNYAKRWVRENLDEKSLI